MSENIASVRFAGKNVNVKAFTRAQFKSCFPAAYAALESSSDMVIPVWLHVSEDGKRAFHVDFGIVSIVHTWDGKRWVEVKS